MDIKNREKLNEIQEWIINNNNLRIKLKNDCYTQTKALIKEFGEETEDTFTFKFVKDEEPCITYIDEYAESYYIQRITIDKNLHNVRLYYSDSDYDSIRYCDLNLDDRMYLLDEMLSLILD